MYNLSYLFNALQILYVDNYSSQITSPVNHQHIAASDQSAHLTRHMPMMMIVVQQNKHKCSFVH